MINSKGALIKAYNETLHGCSRKFESEAVGAYGNTPIPHLSDFLNSLRCISAFSNRLILALYLTQARFFRVGIHHNRRCDEHR